MVGSVVGSQVKHETNKEKATAGEQSNLELMEKIINWTLML